MGRMRKALEHWLSRIAIICSSKFWAEETLGTLGSTTAAAKSKVIPTGTSTSGAASITKARLSRTRVRSKKSSATPKSR